MVENARERRRDYLCADGDAAGSVAILVLAFDAAVLSHVPPRLGVASERSETAPPRACFTKPVVETVG